MMSRRVFHDVPDGDTIIYDVVDETGYIQPVFQLPEEGRREQFKAIADIPCREDDVFLASYPKTGTNWMWEMLSLIIQKTTEGAKSTFGLIEALPPGATEKLKSPRLLNSHLKVKYLPKDCMLKKIKFVLVCRNPKDVVVSFYNHTKGINGYQYSGKFENYFEMFLRGEVDYGSYAEYLLEWQEFIRSNPDIPVHVVYYEDLKKDAFSEMKKVCQFLEKDISDESLYEIVDNCSFNKMRKGKMQAMDEKMKEMLSKMMKDGFNVMRKGQIGDWKNWFTVAQNQRFEEWWNTKAADLDLFKFKYE